MSPRDLQPLEHGGRIRDAGDLRADGGDGAAPDHADVALLEAVVGAADAEEEEGEEDDGADDEKDLELAQRRQRRHRPFRQPAHRRQYTIRGFLFIAVLNTSRANKVLLLMKKNKPLRIFHTEATLLLTEVQKIIRMFFLFGEPLS